MFYVIDKNTGEPAEANGFWAVSESGQLYDVIDGWGCEGGGGSSAAPRNFIAIFGVVPVIEPRQEPEKSKIPCDVCGRKFKTDDAMSQHRNMKHFDIHARNPPAPFPGYPPVPLDRKKNDFIRLSSAPYCQECGHPDCNGQCFGDNMMGSSS